MIHDGSNHALDDIMLEAEIQIERKIKISRVPIIIL
jgi:hypothetical protein